jgi:glycosyltransferase involved in cell wall biosynthesis
MHNELKKTLFISFYAPPSIGGPQIIYNLLRDTDPNSYCILTSFYNINNVSAKIGTWLDGEYIFYDNPKATKDDAKGQEDTNNKYNKRREFIGKLKSILKRSSLMRALNGTIIIFAQIFAIMRQKKIIKEKNIDIIVGLSDYGPSIICSYLLHKLTGKPFYIFLFDLYKGNNLLFPGGLMANALELRMFRSAEKIIVTNEGTKEYYKKCYGEEISKKIVVIYNATFPEPYIQLQNSPQESKPPLSPYCILFTGNIAWPQLRSLKNLIKAVNEINDINIKLKIYSPNPKDYLQKIGITESEKVEISVASPKEIPAIQNKADILFLPLSWYTESQAIVDTATPGKLTDYLIAGKPILIHAPSSSFLVKYAKDNNFAEVVDEENIEKLKESIGKLLTDKELSNTKVKNAKETFFKNHDINKNAILFRSLFLKK